MGNEEPFELKYIGIGNEQWQSEYHQHYKLFVKAFEEAAAKNPELYGDIELIVANGTVSSSYEGWTYIRNYPDEITTLVDEHYYQTPEWFFTNNKRYDSYDRSRQAAVFLGEYAAKSNTMRAALAEASYMTGIERNADVVKMACYAPLFANSTSNQWTPDMMFFSNDGLMLTANYYVQQMFANNVGTNILPSTLEFEEIQAASASMSGRVGLGSWMTSVSYDNLKVVSNDTNEVLYETDFSSDDTLTKDNWTKHTGTWSVKDGALVQSGTGSPRDGNTGDAIYVGDTSWTNYTMTVDAQILSGAEGFLIPVCVRGTDNNIFWNLGGWGNTVSCLQIVENGAKSDQVSGTVKNIKLKHNQVYKLKIVVQGDNIKCYLDDKLYVNYTQENPSSLYETTSIDANGDIIMKFVNPTEFLADVNITLKDLDLSKYNSTASVITLSGSSLADANSFENPNVVVPKDSTATVSENFTYTLPQYSVTIIRVPAK
ncbi:MAG: peptidase, partial [Lachnospiraceae bacterium]|nr:peptidase [Lachnospiraceae bacterium]